MGVMTLVESSRPPNPTSMTATSTPARRKSSRARAVVASKKVGCAAQRAGRDQRVDPAVEIGDGRHQRILGDRPVVDGESLREIDQVGRGEAGRAVPGGAKPGVDHRRHRALAVGAGDVHRRERPLGMAQRGDQRPDVLESELDPELFEPEKIVERFHVRFRCQACGVPRFETRDVTPGTSVSRRRRSPGEPPPPAPDPAAASSGSA